MSGGNHRGLLPEEARLEDYLAQSDRGEIAVSPFLTPGEQLRAARYLTHKGASQRLRLWGGYPDAERRRLYLFPDFYADVPELMPEDGTDPALLAEVGDGGVCAVRIQGSGFRKLSHRDYLGSLLGLGLERDALGDVAVQSDSCAVVFCGPRTADFLRASLEKVASDTVKCAVWLPDDSFTDGRNYRPIHDTVASPRLDCVVAALTNLSRESAQNAIRGGTVEVDFEGEERTDRILTPPATISIRGYGRYVLRGFDGETKKGRLRLRADQLI
ncbi:MAG: hypothetical protein E7620_00915 [Ruminococcaceae bacterium]|nr:hypothetical protein [Oscillospiraceae bacterium]